MPRHHMTAAGLLPFTSAEELERDAQEAAAAAAAPAAALEAARQSAVDAAIQADTVMATIKGMTAAEYDVWWTANVATAAQAITVLKRVVRVLARRVL